MEIERKFLVDNLPFDLEGLISVEISQSYISLDPVIRIRKQQSDYFLTVKGPGSLSHEEFAIEISETQYNDLLKKADTFAIEKTRYFYKLENNLLAEIDKYRKNLQGLTTLEVEFTTVEEAKSFIPPGWFGKEVTHDKKFSNAQLSRLTSTGQIYGQ